MNYETAQGLAANAIGNCSASGAITADTLRDHVRVQLERVGVHMKRIELPAHVIAESQGRIYSALADWFFINARQF